MHTRSAAIVLQKAKMIAVLAKEYLSDIRERFLGTAARVVSRVVDMKLLLLQCRAIGLSARAKAEPVVRAQVRRTKGKLQVFDPRGLGCDELRSGTETKSHARVPMLLDAVSLWTRIASVKIC